MSAFQFFPIFLVLQALHSSVFGTLVLKKDTLQPLLKAHSATLQDLRSLAKHNFSKSYMEDSWYLAPYLAKTNFDAEEAYRMLEGHLAWRTSQSIDDILDEEWSDLKKRFPYTRDTFCKTGEPVLYINFGHWDVSSYLSENSYERFIRYFVMIFEDSFQHLRKLRSEGQEVYQVVLLINLGDYTFSKHACYQCLFLYRDVSTVLYSQLANVIQRSILINVPFLFKTAYAMLGDGPQQNAFLFGQDKEAWTTELLSLMDRDQFPEEIFMSPDITEGDNIYGALDWIKKEL